MTDVHSTDPFVHHPELRGRIVDPLTSFFRGFTVEGLIARFPEMETMRGWTLSDDRREALRLRALEGHQGDLWVFAYGSLMWDPAIRFAEVRRAHVAGHARRFILVDDKGGRGTPEAPGLMATLDRGEGCAGLAFRIPGADVEAETTILWRREMIGPGYLATFVTADLGDRMQPALTFVADHGAAGVRPDLTRAEQARLIATGTGFLGTSKTYLENIIDQIARLGIADTDCEDLLRAVEDYLAARKAEARS
jgi:cation transport protein ChaC